MMTKYKDAMEHFGLSPETDRRMEALLTGEGRKEAIPLKRTKKPIRWLIAAVLVVCLLAGTAWAAWQRLSIRSQDLSVLYDSPSYFAVYLETEKPEPLVFPHYYPQKLPDGFEESFVSWRLYKAQRLDFENPRGELLELYYFAVDDYSRRFAFEGEALKLEERQVNGQIACLVTDEGAEGYDQTLLWVDGEGGIGFRLHYQGQTKINLFQIARSVTEIDESEAPTPSQQARLEDAYALLGHYELGTVPEGYRLIELYGQGQGYEGGLICVDTLYENEDFDTLRFVVQRPPICPPGEEPPEEHDMDAALLQAVDPSPSEIPPLPGEPVPQQTALTIQGLPGLLTEWPEAEDRSPSLTWVDLDSDNCFTLNSSALSAEALIALAESVALIE